MKNNAGSMDALVRAEAMARLLAAATSHDGGGFDATHVHAVALAIADTVSQAIDSGS